VDFRMSALFQDKAQNSSSDEGSTDSPTMSSPDDTKSWLSGN